MNKNRIEEAKLPNDSNLKKEGEKYDYVDSFQTYITTSKHLTSTDIGKAFSQFTSEGSGWIKKLIIIRNSIVRVFGLRETNYKNEHPNSTYKVGEQLFGFKIFDKTENEIVFGKQDKHLNFKSSFLIHDNLKDNQKELYLSTAVKYNNLLGKLYFIPVKPFHRMIMKTILYKIK